MARRVLRRTLSTCSAVVIVGLAAAACGSSGSSSGAGGSAASNGGTKAAVSNVSVTSFTGSFASLPTYVADKLGYFKKNHLDVKQVQVASGTAAAAALLSGSAEFGNFAVFEVLTAASKGQQLQYIAGAATKTFGELVVRTSVAKSNPALSQGYPASVRAVKGLKIAVSSKGSSTYYWLAYMLEAAGLNPNTDITIVQGGTLSSQYAALKAGQIDGFMSQEPETTQVVNAGDGEVAAYGYKGSRPALIKNLMTNGIVATDSFIKQNPTAVSRMHTAIAEADNYIAALTPATAPKVAQAISSDFPGISTKVLTTAILNYKGIYTPKITPSEVTAAAQLLIQNKVITKAVPFGSIVNQLASK